MPHKTKHEKKHKPRRARGIPIQVYVSEAEHSALRKLTHKRDLSVSALVRVWIRRAIAQSQPARVVPADPRQVALFGQLEAEQLEA